MFSWDVGKAQANYDNARHTPDSRIDFSEIPESTDAELRTARQGKPYQTLVHELLEAAVERAA